MNYPNYMKKYLLIYLAYFTLWSHSSINAQAFKYPKPKIVDQTDNYFGIKISDPYRWMEDDRSEETKAWVKQENELTSSYLQQIPFRDSLRARMKNLWNFAKYTPPFKAGHRYFYFKNDGLLNQPVLYMMPGLDYVPMSYFDQNKVSEDGTTSIQDLHPSADGKYMAFVISRAGSDWNEIRIKEISNTKSLPEVLSHVKFSQIAWKDSGFFYSRYDTRLGIVMTSRNEFHKVYYHQLYSAQQYDSLIFQDQDHPLRNFSAYTTPDEKFLIISGSESTSGNNLTIRDLTKKTGAYKNIVPGFNNDFIPVGNIGDDLIFLTNYKAPRKRLILINANTSDESTWKEIVPQQKEILIGAVLSGTKMVLHYMQSAASHLYIYNINGIRESEVPLDNMGTVSEINASLFDNNFFFAFTTFTSPTVTYRFNTVLNKLYVQAKPKLPYSPDDFETKQVTYTSKDGTQIPMFIVHKKGILLNSENPTLLFGYGGFNISKTPEFKPERMIFLEQGGIFAMPCIRGGGEFGEEWHAAGTKLKKQNVFDDFIAAAEYLIKEKYTNPKKLAIGGRSNGGLLVGATLLQRPDLFKVALPAVGVMDMLRYHKFTIGWSWVTDYGSSDKEVEFKALYKYSPLHNIKENINYPAILITTADHDDRVIPAHSFKFAATMQEKSNGKNPVLIRVDTDAGHGSGKPTNKLIEEQADIFTFLFYQLGMKL